MTIAITINGEKWTGWGDLEIHLSMDKFSTAGFEAPFEPKSSKFRSTFIPFTFPEMIVFDDRGDAAFTGKIVGMSPEGSADSRKLKVDGYSLPAVVNDCTAPTSTVPHEFRKLTLHQIAQALMDPFQVPVVALGGSGPAFARVKLDRDKKIIDFLVELAKQRGKLLSNTSVGELLCVSPTLPGSPIATLDDEVNPFEIESEFNAQEYYSEITGYATASRKKRGGKYTLQNPWLRRVLRPLSFNLDDIERGDAYLATRAKMGRMFANMAAWRIRDLPTWRTPRGTRWEPNRTIRVRSEQVMIYEMSELLIRDVWLKVSADKLSCDLGLVLPGSFTGEIPKHLPWAK